MNFAMLASLLTALCTVLGALPILLFTQVTHRGRDILLAFTAGIMVSASTYGLIPSALRLSNLFVLSAGVLLGTAVLLLMERYVPHEDPHHAAEGSALRTGAFFFLAAMALHNLPEGLSVGVSYGSSSHSLGAVVALSIGLQNVPEGFLTALFLITRGMRKHQAIGWTAMTGLVEWLFCWVGYTFSDGFQAIVPYGLAFAAGAMLFVVYKELIPESHGDGNERSSTFAFIVGLLFMIGMTHMLT
ncbi:ZIP family metal transporter [Paenibacillus sp. CCS19]|uniref:ZIP family metal transporter n=1 Tax=Paenibacillus sp. CCS19 TaxID=3158387 RepID=UPI00256A9F3E|nr:ZIP family metal transporter [Paenibacillus cellulosilyticus]GMK39318.1 ZIP family metal transporter [Paenibacillus cellulosilyticus]